MGPSAQPVRHRPAPGPGTGAGAVKHRACDECRSRKLACTKEPGGCARCKREGLDCHYSAQKPMGRPRKRSTVPSVVQTTTVPPVADVVYLDAFPPRATTAQDASDVLIMADSAAGQTNTSLIDPGLDADMTGMNILHFLGPDFMSTQSSDATKPTALSNSLAQPWERRIWKFDIDFDPPLPPPAARGGGGGGGGGGDVAACPYPSLLAIDTPSLSSQGTSPPDAVHPLDPALSSSTATAAATTAADPPLQPVSCACLANLYLALDATARLPAEVMPAMRVARGACKAAHDTILCQICCPPLQGAMRSPPPLAFQNTMVLCALVPSIAEAYHRILALVDAEAARAAAARARVPFSLSHYGGLWGVEAQSCGLAGGGGPAVYEDRLLEPGQWRLAVRALLRVDVYGFNCDGDSGGGLTAPAPPPGPGPGAGCSQVGLRALVAQMEERSRARHEEIDAMIDAGLVVPRTAAGLQPRHTRSLEVEGKQPPCRYMIGMAREAVESLVIP